MSLPDLPKKYNRREAKVDARVAEWLKNNYQRSTLLEVKMKGGRVAEHQKRLIDSVSQTHEFMYKFPDGRTRTPLDYVILKDADAVLAVCTDDGACVLTFNNEHIKHIQV